MTARGDSSFALEHDRFGRLVLIEPGGERHVGASAVRAFPLSAPDRDVAICDESGREVVWIEDLNSIDPAIRRLIEADLAANDFLPTITRIHRISSDSTPCEFDVETDRGPTKFTLDSDEQIRKVGADRLLLTDARGVRYHIPDLRRLDPASRRALERHL